MNKLFSELSPKEKLIYGLKQTWLYKIFKKLKSFVTKDNELNKDGAKNDI